MDYLEFGMEVIGDIPTLEECENVFHGIHVSTTCKNGRVFATKE